jgi:signal peptide peptidase SppA
VNAETFSGLWYIDGSFQQRMERIILPRIVAGKDPIPPHFQLRSDIKFYDENGDFNINAYYLKQYLKEGGGEVAVIPINGTMSRYGFCGFGNERIAAIIAEADKQKDVKGVVLKMDTPGGTVDSTDILADAVRNFSKPIVAWTNFCASAGYFVASQCDSIFLENSISSCVGSIGVLMVYVDQSEALAKAGYQVRIFRADGSEDKARINGIEELTPELIAEIQTDLNDARQSFHGYVRRGRAGKLGSDDVLTGKMYKKKEAKSEGLVDYLGSINDAIKLTLRS